MAIVKEMPGLQIINGFKGSLDFYYWMGIPVCRTWPRSPGHLRSIAVMEGWGPWSYVTRVSTYPSALVIEAYRQSAKGTNLTWRDLMTKDFITASFLDIP